MLLEFGAKNFASFKDGFQVNLRTKGSNNQATNLMAIKGANASGKTNVLKTLAFLSYFTKKSFDLKPDEDIPANSYFRNTKPISMYAIFLYEDKEYKYEIDFTKKIVEKESIYRKDKLIIERIGTEVTDQTNDEFKDLKSMILRDNASIISTANQYGSKSISVIYDLFKYVYTNVSAIGLMDEVIDYKVASEIYNGSTNLLEFLNDVLVKTDTGISNVIIRERIDEETKEKSYYPIFNYDVSEEDNFLTYFDQSSGTKTLFKQLCAYKTVLDLGGILILDELDINLHPDLIPILLNFFESKKLNKFNAQLIFTTHNTEIMDRLKKYRVILVNKEDNESYLYRLDETGEILRNDRSVSKVYSSGRLGGKPIIGLDYD